MHRLHPDCRMGNLCHRYLLPMLSADSNPASRKLHPFVQAPPSYCHQALFPHPSNSIQDQVPTNHRNANQRELEDYPHNTPILRMSQKTTRQMMQRSRLAQPIHRLRQMLARFAKILVPFFLCLDQICPALRKIIPCNIEEPIVSFCNFQCLTQPLKYLPIPASPNSKSQYRKL